MNEDPLRAAIEAGIAAERQEALERLERLRETDTEVIRAANEAHQKFWSLVGTNYDRPLTKEGELARRELLVSMGRVESLGLAFAGVKETLRRLEDPLLIDQRIRERKRRSTPERPTKATQGASSPRVSREERSVAADEARKQAVKALKDAGGDASAAAKALNDAKILTSSGKLWTPRRIRIVTSQAGVERPPRAKKEPAAPRKSNGKDNVVPIDKKTQASGTSRGGTGSRKKTTSQSSSAKTGARRRGKP